MTIDSTDKDFIIIKVPKKIGRARIKRLKDFAKSLEDDKTLPKKVNLKLINQLSREINKSAWEKLKKKRSVDF